MRPELIIFDCDGVLVDSEVLSCRCVSEVLRAHGADLSMEDVMRLFLGRSRKAMLDHFLALGTPLPDSFPELLQARVRQTFTAELKAIEGVSEILDRLDVPFCVASSSDPMRLKLSLQLTGLSQYFGERWFSSESVAAGKPAPDLFLHAANAMGVSTARSLVIEDSLIGVIAAKAAGMTVWGFVGGSHHRVMQTGPELLASGADKIVQSMPELAKEIRGLKA